MSAVQKALIRQYATVAAKKITAQVIADLTSYTITLSGDDSKLENVWEEICVQVQGEESFHWESYQETIRTSVLGRLEELDHHDLTSLWLQTDNGWKWHWNIENEETETPLPQKLTNAICAPYDFDDIATHLVSEYILNVAQNYTNENINAYLNAGFRKDEEEVDSELRERLLDLMPRDSMLLDLWNWDIHFEDESFDDISNVAFSNNDELAEYANILAEDFLRWIDEYEMDYNQQGWQSPDEFTDWIRQQSLDFLIKWRANVKKEFAR